MTVIAIKNIKSSIRYLALLFGVLRAILLFYHNPNLIMNIDEESNYEVATNHFKGRGYTYFDDEKKAFLPTAFHASFTIFVYEKLVENNIHKRYWVAFCNLLSALLLAISIIYFFKLSCLFLPEKIAFYATIAYCIFPSIIYYVGTLFWYEQLVLSVLVVIIYLLIKSITQKISIFHYIALTTGIVLCSLFRIQTLAIFVPLLLLLTGYTIFKQQYQKSLIYLSVILIGIIAHVPGLKKNQQIYGDYILSTQMGYELLQGHNPTAKGSWMGNWLVPNTPLYIYSREKIPDINNLNQYEEGLARKAVAINWIKENPFAELKLAGRKLLLFFFPRNFEFLPFNQVPNPLNLIIYIGFLAYILLFILKKKRLFNIEKMVLFIPVAGALCLTLVFFMGARWRYYAEPFMIIFAFMSFRELCSRLKFLKN